MNLAVLITPMKNTRTADTPANVSSPLDLLRDPTRATVSVSQAAAILGVAKSTAHAAYKLTGYLSPGVPVMQVGRRYTVSVFHLRAALGMDSPDGNQA